MRYRNRQHPLGFVLITVLLVVALLAALLLGFNARLRSEADTVTDWQHTTQAHNSARSGFNIALAAIRENPDMLLQPDSQNLFNGQYVHQLDNAGCTILVREENGKLNVNRLIDQQDKPNRSRIDQLLKLIDLFNQKRSVSEPIAYSLVANLIDWIDADDKITWLDFVSQNNTGVESEYYQTQQPPYRCANRPFATHTELLLVKDMPQIQTLLDHLTIYSDGKVNINTAPLWVLNCLAENMTTALAQEFINYRQVTPFESINECHNLPGMTETLYRNIEPMITVNPSIRYYEIIATGENNAMQQTINAIVEKKSFPDELRIVFYKES